MNVKIIKRVRCIDCAFTQSDKKASNKKWTAYKCGNAESDYFKAVLNVTSDGYKQADITWRGCEQGKPVEGLVSA
jgi:hypothetical protein